MSWNSDTDYAGPRLTKSRTVQVADNPLVVQASIDCTDTDRVLVAAYGQGATSVQVQLEIEMNRIDQHRFRLGDPITLDVSGGLGQAVRVEHGGCFIRARVVSMTPQALGLGLPSPVQSKALGIAPLAVAGHGSFYYTVHHAGSDHKLRQYNALWVQQWEAPLSTTNGDPKGLAAGASRIYVADNTANKLFAYGVTAGAAEAANDIALHAANTDAYGVWFDETTVLVADRAGSKAYGYAYADGARAEANDVPFHAANDNAGGIAYDGTTVWVINEDDGTLFAYEQSDRTRPPVRWIREAEKEWDLAAARANWAVPAANSAPRGLALVGGNTFLVGDHTAEAVYAYGVLDGQITVVTRAGVKQHTS